MTTEPATKRKINWRRVVLSWIVCGIGFAALTIAARTFIAAATPQHSPAPRLIVQPESTQHDFGEAAPGKKLSKTFRVLNGGTQRLILNRQSCRPCGDPRFKPIILAPGESTRFELTLDTTGKSGRLQRVVRFTTSDPQRPRIAFTLQATVTAATP